MEHAVRSVLAGSKWSKCANRKVLPWQRPMSADLDLGLSSIRQSSSSGPSTAGAGDQITARWFHTHRSTPWRSVAMSSSRGATLTTSSNSTANNNTTDTTRDGNDSSSSNFMLKNRYDWSQMFMDVTTSSSYAQHRAAYSPEIFQMISDYCREISPAMELALDVGCGPGNSTVGFTKHFKKVIGVDISHTQIAAAPKNIPNCDFRVGASHLLHFIKSGSVDLFASGLAFNLMPQKQTFAEADRVLKPGGTIAIFGYGLPRTKDERLNAVFTQALGEVVPYMPREVLQLWEAYKDIEIPYPGWIRKDGIVFQHRMSAEGIAGMGRLIQRLIDNIKPEKNINLIEGLKEPLKEAAASQDKSGDGSGHMFDIEYDAVILMGRKPLF